jgi:mono/diheme cytochrome c family protein
MAVSFTTIGLCGVIATGLALAVAGYPAAAASPDATTPGSAQFALKSVSVDLPPDSDRSFPPGPGVEVVSSNCVACHSAGMVLTQPALSRAVWDAEVHKMIATYKAPITEADAATIVAYLAQLKVGN